MPSFNSLSRALAAISILIACSTAQQCYFPDGSESNHTPCTSNGSPTACCAASAYCMENGLCFEESIVTRGSCTDQDWGEGNCPGYCIPERPGGSIVISPCSNNGTRNTFVCDLGNTTSKCEDRTESFSLGNNSNLVLRPAQVTELVGSAVSSAIASATPSTNSSNTASADATEMTPSSESLETACPGAYYTSGDMAGLGVGLGIPLFISACYAFTLWKKERARTPKLMYPLPDEKPPTPPKYFPPKPIERSLASRDGYPASKVSYDSFRQVSPVSPPHMQTFAERYQAMSKTWGGSLHEQNSFELEGQPIGSAFRFATHHHGKPHGEREQMKKNSVIATTIELGSRTNKSARDRSRSRNRDRNRS